MTNVPHKGRGKQPLLLEKCEELEMANQLNLHFCRFDKGEGNATPVLPPPSLTKSPFGFYINEIEVSQIFKKCNPRKNPGPDKICGNVLKHCAAQLAPVFTDIFRASYNSGIVPVIWKTSTIVPVAKFSRPLILNDFRPIALTSLVMKSFERLVKKHIVSEIEHLIDPLQFAHQVSS